MLNFHRLSLGALGQVVRRRAPAPARIRRRIRAMAFGHKIRSAEQGRAIAEVVKQNREDLPRYPEPQSFSRRRGNTVHRYGTSYRDRILASKSVRAAEAVFNEALRDAPYASADTHRKWLRAVDAVERRAA